MKSVKVTYTVKASFVAKNKENISIFINDLQKMNNDGIRYSIYLGEDGKTFTHLSLYKDEIAQQTFLEMDSFKAFQEQRDASGLEVEPNIELMNLVASY
ncbi:hypothetical protein FBD94_01515 [Pedobacter hiemivivus]|uniref:ABM domain-containing protein n=1 Tax=Pedobacter hiemivivus TaxID=2530454 RepID=A0A4R0NEP0_9SPHI|nr:hypothetical protein [Pedobacter hiemivivus]TCC98608.1 hypothetical protein EZ444_04850 [Pedobacter hiemivivus]TKC65257.1 hypothetical protein FBD94_01515 [Pedobacter hiemivivus]